MLGIDSDSFITSRLIMEIFAKISNTRGCPFFLCVSYIEIYNEKIKDMPGNGSENLRIHEDVVNKRVYVNAKDEFFSYVDDVTELLVDSEQTRAVGITDMFE